MPNSPRLFGILLLSFLQPFFLVLVFFCVAFASAFPFSLPCPSLLTYPILHFLALFPRPGDSIPPLPPHSS